MFNPVDHIESKMRPLFDGQQKQLFLGLEQTISPTRYVSNNGLGGFIVRLSFRKRIN